MTISLIASVGKNYELGNENTLAWRLPDDLKRFKALTTGHAVIMGRKTFESIGRPLPNRDNIVVTRNKSYKPEGVIVVDSIEAAIKVAKSEEVFIIGGGQIYALGLPYANKMYLTIIDASAKADAFFPKFDEKEWRIVSEEHHAKDEKHAQAFTYKVFERI